MINDPLFGPVATDLGWVPAPRYLMRRARVKALAADLPPGRLLEIGPGSGAMLYEFDQAGHACEALDSSDQARQRTGQLLRAGGRDEIPIHSVPLPQWRGRFDTILAFEVLEHIEDDVGALRAWREWLRPGGVLLISVPARMRLWTARDEWAGHFRRYEDGQLRSALADGGFEVVDFECYGFPLTNLSEWISAPIFARGIHRSDSEKGSHGKVGDDRRRNNDRSGVDRRADLKLFPLVRSWPGRVAIRAFTVAQHPFLGMDLGSGYVVKARRT